MGLMSSNLSYAEPVTGTWINVIWLLVITFHPVSQAAIISNLLMEKSYPFNGFKCRTRVKGRGRFSSAASDRMHPTYWSPITVNMRLVYRSFITFGVIPFWLPNLLTSSIIYYLQLAPKPGRTRVLCRLSTSLHGYTISREPWIDWGIIMRTSSNIPQIDQHQAPAACPVCPRRTPDTTSNAFIREPAFACHPSHSICHASFNRYCKSCPQPKLPGCLLIIHSIRIQPLRQVIDHFRSQANLCEYTTELSGFSHAEPFCRSQMAEVYKLTLPNRAQVAVKCLWTMPDTENKEMKVGWPLFGREHTILIRNSDRLANWRFGLTSSIAVYSIFLVLHTLRTNLLWFHPGWPMERSWHMLRRTLMWTVMHW